MSLMDKLSQMKANGFNLSSLKLDGQISATQISLSCFLVAASSIAIASFLWPKNWYPEATGPKFKLLPMNRLIWDMITRADEINVVCREASEKYGELVWFNALGSYYLVIGDADMIRAILHDRKHFENPPEFRDSVNYHSGGNSMFSSEGEQWKTKHSILQPMLRAPVLRRSAEMVYRKTATAIEILAQMSEGREEFSVDISGIVRKITIDAIGNIAFGTDLNTLGTSPEEATRSNELQINFEGILNGINFRSVQPRIFWYLKYVLDGEEKHSKGILQFFKSLLEKRKEELSFESQEEEPRDLISLIMKFKKENPDLAEKVYPEIDILSECISLFGAGHDTTTNTTSILFHHLTKYPHVQQKIREEFSQMKKSKEAKGEDPNNITFEDLQSLRYLGNVIKESQRIMPVVNSLIRYAVEDTEVKGVKIKKGTPILLNTWYLSLSPKIHHNPEEFIPERWDEEGAQNIPFYPFGHGTRICFGQKLALMEIKIAVLMVLDEYDVLEDKDRPVRFYFNFGVAPVNKQTWIKLRKLNK